MGKTEGVISTFPPSKVKNPAEKRSRWFKKQFGCVILEAKVPVGRGNRRAQLRVPCGTNLSPGGRKARGKTPDMEVATTDQIFPMVQHNLGIGFFPEELAAEHIAQGKIVQIPIEEPLPERKICLIRNVKRPQSIAARSLEEHLTSHRETE